MTNEIINRMIEEINGEIGFAFLDYKRGHMDVYEKEIARINGMIAMLKIATGNRYKFDENGLHEKAEA